VRRSTFRRGLQAAFLWVLVRRARPYAGDDLARPALVFAPHQDDETLGCGGMILKKKEAGADLGLVFLADGGTSHSRLMTPELMAQTRRREALAAAAVLGLEPADVVFLALPNRRVAEHQPQAVAEILTILDQRQPAEIFVPYAKEPPADHTATHRIVMAALHRWQRAVRVYEYPIWFWEHYPWMTGRVYGPRSRLAAGRWSLQATGSAMRDLRCRIFIGDVLDRKRQALAEHRSQMSRLVDDPRWHTLADVGAGDFLACFFRRHELFHAYRLASAGGKRAG